MARGNKPIELGDSWFLPKLTVVKSRDRVLTLYSDGFEIKASKGVGFLSNSKGVSLVYIRETGSQA